jgi:hypothetical protein
MDMVKIIIDIETLKSANFLLKELSEKYPLLDGRMKIYKEPEITTLNVLIEREKENKK